MRHASNHLIKTKCFFFLQRKLIRVHQLEWAPRCNGALMTAVIITGDLALFAPETLRPSQLHSVYVSFAAALSKYQVAM